jgi:protein TonB
MNAIGLHPVYKPRDPSKRYVGIVIVIALHALMLYGIVTGTAKNALLMAKKSLEAVVIQEVIIPPPPPPPKEVKQPDLPKPDVPPPFMPPPDFAPAVSSGIAIASTATPPPPQSAPVIAPPPPPAPNRSDIRVACPTQVPPEMPRKALQDGTEGVVKAQAVIKDGVVHEVTVLSGPRVFHAAVRAAMMQYKCVSGSGEVVATQEFAFKID